jgi:hypothetical protein
MWRGEALVQPGDGQGWVVADMAAGSSSLQSMLYFFFGAHEQSILNNLDRDFCYQAFRHVQIPRLDWLY